MSTGSRRGTSRALHPRCIQHWTLTRQQDRDSVMPGEDDMAMIRTRHRFSLEEYHRIGEAGILDEDERVELVEGEIVEMTPIGGAHASVVARISELLFTHFKGRDRLDTESVDVVPT